MQSRIIALFKLKSKASIRGHFAQRSTRWGVQGLLAALSPAVGSLIAFVRKRQLSVLGLFALAGIAVKVLSALLFHDARLVLISDSLLSGVYGLLLLVSVLIGKPVVVVLVTSMYTKSGIVCCVQYTE